ncbi:hypothetical protein E4T38_04842 [Aureobasidium subglaciale]|nr:hypothetical protein E4T38_04842 [Aureobasidium subglaciale]KAI5222796.1 hypothetical protein E4T40_04756 [Aureobasidium subglaciale]KAI5226608.1 hypothetical protein E4T41_04699 [Aureobasidium subglaciale]KAI5263067.1 hypothetical protein E4T46_03944 [Aureobasidium subglaciale]
MANTSTSELIRAMRQVDKRQISVAEKSELVSAAQDLILEVERPWDTILRIGWSQPSLPATLCTLIDLKLFERWVASDDEVQSASDLGEMVDCDPDLMSMNYANIIMSVESRLLQNLVSHQLLGNPGPDSYSLTDFTRSLADPDQSAAFPFIYEVKSPTYASLPRYLKNEGYRNPIGKSPAACAFTLGTKFDGTLFDYFAQNPDVNERFGRCMKGFAGNLVSWVDQYPTEKLLDGLDQVIVVDVGGSTGHDLNAFQRKHRLAPARLILQDLPEVVAKANVEDGIQLMAHDFFTPQPIKGARVYYLHSVLHDWPDHKAREILQMLKPAMIKGKSKILIHEHVLWPQNNTPLATWSDLLMLGLMNGCERTIGMWKDVIEPVGLVISEVYTSVSSPHSILELKLI